MGWTRNRIARWSMGAVFVGLLLGVATWLTLIGPRRAEAADLRSQDVAAQQSNAALRSRLAELHAQFARLPETRAKLAEIRRQLPAGAEIPAFVRALDGLAASSGAELVSITPSGAEAVDATGGSGKAATTGGSGSASGTASAADLVAIPVSVVVSGDYFQAVAFLRQLQTAMPRAFLVTGLELGQSDAAGAADDVEVTVIGKIFTMPPGKAGASSVPTPVPSAAPAAPPSGSSPVTPASGATPASSVALALPALGERERARSAPW